MYKRQEQGFIALIGFFVDFAVSYTGKSSVSYTHLLVLFIVIFLCCVVLPFFYPIDLYYQDVTQANVAPGFSMLNVPLRLANNAQQLRCV